MMVLQVTVQYNGLRKKNPVQIPSYPRSTSIYDVYRFCVDALYITGVKLLKL